MIRATLIICAGVNVYVMIEYGSVFGLLGFFVCIGGLILYER